MEKINNIKSTMVPLLVDNIDTDQIIPARFLKSTSKEGFGKHLFKDWRYNGEEPVKDFVLNQFKYDGDVLVAGKNFGCGSSREHAAWALTDYGFKAIISTEFADIFKANALNNGLLPVTVTDEFMQFVLTEMESNSTTEVEIDLANQIVKCGYRENRFEIDAFKKKCLMEGKTEFDFLMESIPEIEQYEKPIMGESDFLKRCLRWIETGFIPV